MSNKKQTAVEFLVDQLEKWELYNKISFQCLKEIEQAKAMEKEQMIEFSQEVFRNRYNQITQSLGNIADDIYNENYGE
jgi:hypothetical protein